MFYGGIIPLPLFFMWNSKGPSSFIVNKSREEIKDASSCWFLFCYHWSSMQLIFESVWKPCTQVMWFFKSKTKYIGNLKYHCAKTRIIFFTCLLVWVCMYVYLYVTKYLYLCGYISLHTVPQRHRNKYRHRCLIGAVLRTFPCSSLRGAMKTAICTSHHVVQHVCV